MEESKKYQDSIAEDKELDLERDLDGVAGGFSVEEIKALKNMIDYYQQIGEPVPPYIYHAYRRLTEQSASDNS